MLSRLALLIFTITCSGWLYAASVLPLGLDGLNADARDVFLGTCISNESQFDPTTQMIVTYTTFEVEQAIKGETGTTRTIKQVGGVIDGEGLVMPGVPKFVPGERYMLFLPPPSSLGFSSPVGLEQGSFAVYERDGAAFASNGRSLSQLLEKVPSRAIPAEVREKILAAPPGFTRKRNELSVAELVELVRGLNR